MMNNRHEYIQSVIDKLSDHDKNRLRVAQEGQMYEYFYFNVSIFNAGAVITIRQTDKFIEKNIDDGYSFYLLQSDLELFTF